MAGLLNRLAPKGYPGQIFVCMLRYGYGTQSHIEKMEILHNWYSHLRAFLPEKYGKKPQDYPFTDLMQEAFEEMNGAFDKYDPAFEDMQTCNPGEKEFIRALWAVYERLDEITAQSRIIDDLKTEGEAMEV